MGVRRCGSVRDKRTTSDFPRAVEIARWIRDRNPDAKIIAGGPHATLCPSEFLENGFDIVCVGDGEACVSQLNDGSRVIEGWLTNIDAYHPDRNAVDLWDYEFRIDGERATSMISARGCSYARCHFCSRWDRHVRFHSPEYVGKEIKDIVEHGFKAIALYDDEFFTNPKRDEQIVGVLGKHDMVWRCFGHTKYVLKNRELVKQASRNGLREVLLGIESGSDHILRVINKGATVKENIEAIEFLHELGIRVKNAMMVGLPSESEETLKETWKFCEKVEPYTSDWDFCPFVPYPGSRIYEHPELFDISFKAQDTYRAYKGMHAEGWEPLRISTSKLNFERIMEFREHLEERFKYGGREG